MKDGIKITVGHCNDNRIMALPGANDDVAANLNVLVEGLKAELDKHLLAENLAAKLREILRKFEVFSAVA